MILVTGATGHLGKATVDFLLKKTAPSNIAVLVRDSTKAADFRAKGVEVRQGDYSDYDSLVKAFTGVDKLYFVSGTDLANRSKQHENVVNAAKAAGVKHVVYTSFQRKNETETSPIAFVAKSHLDTEKLLKVADLPYTILKHAVYMDMLPIFIGDQVLETGVIFQPAGDGKASFALRADMAAAAANILTSEGHENKTYDISGKTAYSFGDIAQIISRITGKQITYVSPSLEEFQQALTKVGVPAEYIGLFAGFSEGIKQGEFDLTDATLERLLDRKPATLEEYLNSVYFSGN
jgi:NAD(P)H dehydrogenase (quinone)